jgi:hypothetical protein
VLVVEEAIKGISPEDEERTKEEMVRKGAIIVKLNEIL